MKEFPPNIDPNLFSLSAVVIGIALVDDFSPAELSSLSNWLILLGQYVLTYASQKQLIENRMDNIVGDNSKINDFDTINDALDKIKMHINNFKN